MGVVAAARRASTPRSPRIAHAARRAAHLDEVMTGFRVAPRRLVRARGACRRSWAPDLMTFGKVMGGGLPAAAFGGRADVMAHLAPAGPVYQAGTLAGNPVAAACGLATLRALHARASTRTSTRRPRRSADWCPRRSPRRVSRTALQTAGQPVLRLLPRRGRRRTTTRPAPRRPGATPRSSTPCSTGGLPPAERVRGLVRLRLRTTTPRSTGRRRPARRGRGRGERAPRHAEGVRVTTRTVVHLLRHGEVTTPPASSTAGCPGYRLSELGRQMAERVAEAPRRPRHRRRGELPAGARPGDRRARSPRRTAWRSRSTNG